MNGILIVDKPQGPTSHDVVNFIRKRFNFKKVGHAGTLDPMATGLLIILIGKYTKHSDHFLNCDKEYDATMTLGATSDTGDAWGKISPCKTGDNISGVDIKKVFGDFTGPMEQNVPSYSAKKFKGKKLYELARKGIEVKLEPRKITINSIDIMDIKLPEISFKVLCSKGTYIRQLCMDIGSRLGCGAYLSRLRRTKSGLFGIEGAIKMGELENMDTVEIGRNLIHEIN